MEYKPQRDWTDWLSYVLYGLVGGLMGGFCGVKFLMRLERHIAGAADCSMGPFAIGTMLVGIGIGSLKGGKIWEEDDCLDFPREAPLATWLAKGLSIVLVGMGVLVAGTSLARLILSH